MTRPRHLTPVALWSDTPGHPWSVGYALPFGSGPFAAENDEAVAPKISAVTHEDGEADHDA